ncbi:RHS repeat-associated core domain-containing protein [uncultured Pseudomonas sp.]|uniref:RHS repeat domain-containing protein n=1 Tax=uncultured Pseudomonas sp. TaxID=114707 RepID=UPI0025D61F8D|nr:RHS repeat-associated core domain-containing protein [uncultured Pseudomonas sp.]
MTASTSVHSNALNFMGYMKNGVDPRTGQYTLSIDLPTLAANELRGPELPLTLAYNPLNTTDSGFGLGWNLQLSQYQLSNQVIAVSGGESFKVTGTGDNGRLLMKEQKIEGFRLYDLGNERYRLAHKSGLVEMLEVRGVGNSRAAVPVQVLSPAGHAIALDYDIYNGHALLKTITDACGETLLSIIRRSHEVEILLRPYAGPDGALARFVMALEGSDHHVTRISLPTEDPASWRLNYSEINGQLRLSTVHTPTGAQEDIYYRDAGHAFPAQSGRAPLPRVTRHVIHPGRGQPEMDVRYTYSSNQHNFLGAGLPIAWLDDGLDNLYRYNQPYEYQTTETLHVAEKPVRAIQRTFNRFHLLTEEVTIQGNTRKTLTNTYHDRDGLPFEQQPRQCQLPSEVKTRWSLADDATRIRSERLVSRFDDHGNVVYQQQANGVAETLEWYPADGSEDGCPADPEGFVRHLKSRTRHPAPGQGDAPQTCTRHRYLSLAALDDSGQPDWIAPQSETLVQWRDDGTPEVELQHSAFEYLHVPQDAFAHARRHRESVTLNGLTTVTEHAWSKPDDPPSGQPVVEVSDTTIGFDDARRTVLRQDALYSGQTLLTRIDDVECHYRYDALDRVVQETLSPGTAFEAVRHYSYVLSDRPDILAEQTVVDARQVTTRTLLDGVGRAVEEQRDHLDDHDPWASLTLYEARYDAWNRISEEVHHDQLEGQLLTLAQRYEYDIWGEQRCVVGPDGVAQHRQTDPIGTPESAGPIVRSWTQAAGDDGAISGLSETWMNLFDKPTREARLDAKGLEVSHLGYAYDGLGRCIESTDEYGERTVYAYDAWSRLTENTLPDNSVIIRHYAPHSSEALATAIEVRDAAGANTLMGEQGFDGLSRLSHVSVGQRTEHFSYQGGHLQVQQRTTGAGAQVDYQYNLQLTDTPTTVTVATANDTASFDYDPVSARLTSAGNALGCRRYGYDEHNRLLSQDWIDAQGREWQTLYEQSWQERLVKTTEPAADGGAGLATRRTYDQAGKLKTLEQGKLRGTFDYDALGRPQTITSHDQGSGNQVQTLIDYDDQGRETLRTLSPAGQPEQIIEQRWRLDGLLENRHWQQAGSTLLNEDFEYDARGRLSKHLCSGTLLPRDELGRSITSQLFIFDALDNITTLLSRFDDGQSERARFTYDLASPCQLTGVSYTPARVSGNLSFSYDADGNQLNDEQGRQLAYDPLSRLQRVSDSAGQALGEYRYDSHDQLVNTQQAGQAEALHFYEGDRISSRIHNGVQTHWLQAAAGEQPLGQQQPGNDQQTLLLCDANHSVRGAATPDTLRQAVYSAYGQRSGEEPLGAALGFNGEPLDEASGWYLLGKGYRAYNPALMRFHSPDSLSPFEAGGLNPYTYCLGNPIALRDPTGHAAIGFSGRLRTNHENESWGGSGGSGGSILGWVFVALGVIGTVAAVAAAIATYGLLTPVAVGAAEGTAAATAAAAGATAATSAAAGGAASAGGVSLSGAVAFGALSTSAALSAGSTVASAIGTATGDEQANQWAQYLGIGAAVTGLVGGAAYSMASSAAKAARAAGQASAAIGRGSVSTGMATVARNSIDDIGQNMLSTRSVLPVPRATLASASSPAATSAGGRSWLSRFGGFLIPRLPQGAPNAHLPRLTVRSLYPVRGSTIHR